MVAGGTTGDESPVVARMFTGEYTHQLDEKRRIIVPSDWRARVGRVGSLFVLPHFEQKCLNVYPLEDIEERMAGFRKHQMADNKAMEFSRILGSSSDIVTWDGQGRIRIRDKLLAFAGITDQVVMCGAMDKFQIWSQANHPGTGDVDQAALREIGMYVNF